MTAIVTMNAADLRGLAVHARDALIHDKRTSLHGVHFRPAEDGAEAVASNGRGLALLSLPSAAIEGTLPDAGITVPSTTVLLFPDTEGTIRVTLGDECSLEYRDRIEKAAPVASQYPDYRAVFPEPGTDSAISAFRISAGEIGLAATALKFFAINADPPYDTAEFLFHAPNGPHEIRLEHRDDIHLLFMPRRDPESASPPTKTPE